jgi:hypothetical protein
MMDDELEPFETGGEAPEGNLLSRLGWLFFSPSKLYADIERSPSWWEGWLWTSAFGVVTVYFFFPIQMALMKLNPTGMDEEKLAQAIESIRKFYFIGFLSAPITVLIQVLLVSALGYAILTAFTSEGSFKKYLTLYFYSYVIVSVGSLLSTLLTRMQGVENIRSIQDAGVSFGLDFLMPAESKYLHVVAASLNVFSIWAYVILAMGLMYMFRLKRSQAVWAVAPIWFVLMLFSLIGAKFSRLM